MQTATLAGMRGATTSIASLASIASIGAVLLTGCGAGAESGGSTRAGKTAGTSQAPKAVHVAKRHRKLPPRCDGSQLVAWHRSRSSAGLGTNYTVFDLTNVSKHACSISGVPTLVALGVDGRAIGEAAKRGSLPNEAKEGPVPIAAGDSAIFRASWEADVFGPGECRPRIVAGYRVVLPGAARRQSVPFPSFGRCTNAATKRSFSVGRIESSRQDRRREGPDPPPKLSVPRPGEVLPRCRPSKLLVWIGLDFGAGVAAGTSYVRIDVANLSGSACTLTGIPHVVAIDLEGRAIGSPVRRSSQMVSAFQNGRHLRIARLEPEGSARFVLAIVNPYDFGRGACGFKTTAGLRVTLPGARRAQTVPVPLMRCPGPRSQGQLTVGRIE